MTDLTPQQEDAADLLTDLETHATGYGWSPTRRGVNATYAWGTFERDYDAKLQAFYSVDPTKPDKFISGNYVIEKDALRGVIEAKPRTEPLPEPATPKKRSPGIRSRKPAAAKAVPPTDNSPLPPTDETVPPIVPPTEDVDIVPPTSHINDRISDPDPEPGEIIDGLIDVKISDEGHDEVEWEDPDPPVDFTDYPVVTPGPESEAIADFLIDVKASAEGHNEIFAVMDKDGVLQLAEVEEIRDRIAAVEPGHPAADDPISADAETKRNWSSLTSPLTEAELLNEVTGSEVYWINRISGKRESAVVSDTTRHPPRITPERFDPDEFGEDLRVLHFIELGAGFRSVAVARIVKIG